MEKDTNLLYPKGQEPKNNVTSLMRLFATTVVFILVALCVWYGFKVFLYTNQSSPIDEVVGSEENTKAGEKLANLYKKERQAGSVATDKQNYGLQEGKAEARPTGIFVFSGRQLGSNAGPYVRTYGLNLADVSAGYWPLYPEHQFSALAEFKSNEEVFLLATSSRSMAEEQDKIGVHFYNSATHALTSYKATQGLNERNFAWSEKTGLLAFNRMKVNQERYLDLIPLENWEVVIFDPQTDSVVRTIEGGSQPQWSPDGTVLLYLKSDGLYSTTLSSSEETKVVNIPEGSITTSMSMLSLSPNGEKLLWTTAKAGVIAIYEITSWSPFAIKEVARIQEENTEYYWPLFSPDSAFYAVQAIDRLKGEDIYRKNPRVEIRGTMYKEVSLAYPLSGLNFDELFTDAWVR